jgi:UBX domain-containing protein 1
MAEMRRKQEEEAAAKGKGKGTESYAGGSVSGMGVFNPGDEDDFKRMQQHATSGPAEGARQITIYRNGFTVDGGPLRSLEDPLNKKFYDDIVRGQVPEEFAAAGSDVNVSLTDQREKDYSPPAASSSQPSRTPAAPAKIDNPVAGGDASVSVDASKPTTKIQIRFHDGSKKAQEFNQDQTVGDLRNFCSQVTGVAMTIKGGFPPKPLTDDTQTLKDAGLCGAAVTVAPA